MSEVVVEGGIGNGLKKMTIQCRVLQEGGESSAEGAQLWNSG